MLHIRKPNWDQNRLWSVFECYASGEFNVVADYRYNSPEEMLRSCMDFIPRRSRSKFLARWKEVVQEMEASNGNR